MLLSLTVSIRSFRRYLEVCSGGKEFSSAGQPDHSHIVSIAQRIHSGHHVYMELTPLCIHGRVVHRLYGDVIGYRDIDL